MVPKTDDEPNPIPKIHQLLCGTEPHQRDVGQLPARHHRDSLDPDRPVRDEEDRPGQVEEKILQSTGAPADHPDLEPQFEKFQEIEKQDAEAVRPRNLPESVRRRRIPVRARDLLRETRRAQVASGVTENPDSGQQYDSEQSEL